jgi:hypothetical protein
MLSAAAVAPPTVAEAASLAVFPAKSCYRSGEALLIGGAGYTPNGQVRINSGTTAIGTVGANANGDFTGKLSVAQPRGEGTKTYIARDVTDAALSATLTLRVSALDVDVRPSSGRPGRRLRIRARGFTTGRTLYAHVVSRRFRRNVRVGRLSGPCGRLSVRRKIFPRSTPGGRYTVQFDTRRRYSRSNPVKIRYRVRVSGRRR